MNEDFAHPVWAEAHEKFSAEVAAGFGRLVRWLRCRAKAKDESHAVTLGEDRRNDQAIHTRARRGAEAERGLHRPRQDRGRAEHQSVEASGEGESLSSTPSDAHVAIAPEPATSAAAQYCLGEYYRELGDRFDGGFDPEFSLFPSLDEFAPPHGIFLVVRLDGEPVGCGGLKPISAEAVYLKRMWIAPKVRGLGFARRLLSALEEQARTSGYSLVRLETNKTLVEAQQLYRSSGYREVPPFNDEPYAHHWFEKGLHRGNGRQPDRRALS